MGFGLFAVGFVGSAVDLGSYPSSRKRYARPTNNLGFVIIERT